MATDDCIVPQSRQSAKLFLQSSELGLPTPLAAVECAPHPLVRGGGGRRAHSLAGEGLGESQFRRGDLHSGALYMYKYFVYCTNVIE